MISLHVVNPIASCSFTTLTPSGDVPKPIQKQQGIMLIKMSSRYLFVFQSFCQSTVSQSLISINDKVVRGQRENQKWFRLLKTYFGGDDTRCSSPIRKTYQVFVVNKDTLWVESIILGIIFRYSSPITESYQVFVANNRDLLGIRRH